MPPVFDYRAAVITSRLPLVLDPLLAPQDPGVAEVSSLLYRPLLRLDNTGYPAPDLASAWSTSVDGLTYTLQLQPGLRWSNGSPLTLRDVLATIQWVQSPGFPEASLAAAWQGVDAQVAGSHLLLTLSGPRASFAVTLTQLPILPLGGFSTAAIQSLPRHPSSPLPTSGPYMVSGETAGNLTLTANPHAGPAPRLGRVELEPVVSFQAAAALFAAGRADLVLATSAGERSQLLRRPGSAAHDVITFGFVDLLFNERTPGLDDRAVRSAIRMAVDRDRVVASSVGGLGAVQTGPIPAGILWLQQVEPVLGPPDPGGGVSQLDTDGWLPGASGVRSHASTSLRFTLSVADSPPLPSVAADIATQLQALGISVTLSVVPAASFLSQVLVPGRFQLAIAAWDGGADPDVSQYWSSGAAPPLGYNVSGEAPDAFLDQDLEELATFSTQQDRVLAASRVTIEIDQTVPAVFLYAPEETLVASSRLPGIAVPATGDPFADAASWP